MTYMYMYIDSNLASYHGYVCTSAFAFGRNRQVSNSLSLHVFRDYPKADAYRVYRGDLLFVYTVYNEQWSWERRKCAK